MSSIKEVLPAANQILKKYYLCDSCLGRLFSKRLKLSSNRLLGKKLKQNFPKSSKKCYVCKNLLDNLASYLELMLESSLNHGFSSFVVGAMIQPSIIDRDDFLRSKYRLRGIDGVKTDITREISKQFAKKTKKKLDFLDPDITFTLNLKESTCLLRSKPLSLQGRYNKYKRGFSQKQKSCENCYGKGCRNCTFHGFTESESVEAKISQFLFSKFGGTIAKFTWIGGDDKSSLVLGMGRPFFVRIQNPTRRKAKLPKKIKLESLIINNFKIIAEVPKKPLRFRSIIEIKITTENNLQPSSLRKLKKFLEIPIIIYENSGKRSEKKIFDVRYKINSKNKFTLKINAEGGLPIKRFLIGDNVVPGISQTIENNCKCDEFDFLEIKMITNN
ncbi:MAG TPA: tRNA pseudouridine(54/55) synthase Pus10 [Nitrosopumilaceae archaeon]|jgi:tRNA pseudouridine synthase 10|nr:tRNA pseudouridine(54/55) synthase Pus10 [Nitrosopumilaceae archaeon]